MKILRLLFAFLAAAFAGRAAAESNGPASLVLTYRAPPATRAAFRAWLETKGAAQFAAWKKDGVFAEAQILFGSFAATSTLDAIIILDFAHYTDSARWKEVEKKFPGGLPAEALALAAPESASYADVISHGVAAKRDPAKAAYMIAFYEVLTDIPKYEKYAEGYTAPQMRGWIEAGALSGFTLLLNQTPLGKPWDALLVLEYTDIAGLARRDEVKAAVRAQLAKTDPAWVAWSKDKTGIRKELSLFIADAITPAAPP